MCCSNRTKHADLTLSASHRVGQHPVKSDRSEQQRDAGKGEEQRRGKPRLRHRACQPGGERFDCLHCRVPPQFGHDVAHLAAVTDRIAGRAHNEVHLVSNRCRAGCQRVYISACGS
jgi:hypothetical protein